MYPLRSLNVPLGIHVPRFGNPCIKGTIAAFFVFAGCCLNTKKKKKDMRCAWKCSSPSSVGKCNQTKNHIIVVCGKC